MAHKTDFCPLKGLAEVAKRTFRFANNVQVMRPRNAVPISEVNDLNRLLAGKRIAWLAMTGGNSF